MPLQENEKSNHRKRLERGGTGGTGIKVGAANSRTRRPRCGNAAGLCLAVLITACTPAASYTIIETTEPIAVRVTETGDILEISYKREGKLITTREKIVLYKRKEKLLSFLLEFLTALI